MARLDVLTVDDLPAVMRIERMPDYAELVGRFTPEEHATEMASPDAHYLAWREGEELLGFVILQEFRQPVILLRRIAVAEPGRGIGTALLRAVMDRVFETTPAEGLRLHVHHNNSRARHVYEREGFEAFGVSEKSGVNLSIPRERWAARRGQ
jgi:RimJ/RimL family protein N-acetyltransferase